jgi:hypothetical protein
VWPELFGRAPLSGGEAECLQIVRGGRKGCGLPVAFEDAAANTVQDQTTLAPVVWINLDARVARSKSAPVDADKWTCEP